jgi:GntR family transcriptional regulator/MocR family aminotransferase
VIEQLTLAELITSGGYDRHIRRSRLAYRRRRDRLVAALAREAPHVVTTGIAAGLHALVQLPGGSAETDVVTTAAANHDLALEGLGTYHAGGPEQPPALVVGYATPPDHAFTATTARLAALLAAG